MLICKELAEKLITETESEKIDQLQRTLTLLKTAKKYNLIFIHVGEYGEFLKDEIKFIVDCIDSKFNYKLLDIICDDISKKYFPGLYYLINDEYTFVDINDPEFIKNFQIF